MTKGDILPVHQYTGPAWEAALQLFESGKGTVGIGTVHIQRWVGWPGADGAVHLQVFTGREPKSLTLQTASTEISAGVEAVAAAKAADRRLGELFSRYGVVWEYCYDYGMGTIRLAVIDHKGRTTWEPGFRPVPV